MIVSSQISFSPLFFSPPLLPSFATWVYLSLPLVASLHSPHPYHFRFFSFSPFTSLLFRTSYLLPLFLSRRNAFRENSLALDIKPSDFTQTTDRIFPAFVFPRRGTQIKFPKGFRSPIPPKLCACSLGGCRVAYFAQTTLMYHEHICTYVHTADTYSRHAVRIPLEIILWPFVTL